MSRVSVLIPTHDRAPALAETLNGLARLRIPAGTEVELVVVANACSDDTVRVATSKGDGLPFPTRTVEEPVTGLNPARNRAVVESTGELLAFLDDDVTVEPGWLEGLVGTFASYPADLLAGRTLLGWNEVTPPAWLSEEVERLLSRLDRGEAVAELAHAGPLVGANFAVRRTVLEKVGSFAAGLDRSGRDLLSGGDTDLAVRALEAGFRLFYAPSMAVHHRVAPHRLSRRYLDRVARGRGRTRVTIARMHGVLSPLRLLRSGLAQTALGASREAGARLRGDRRRAMAARMSRMRGLGTLAGAARWLLDGGRVERREAAR